MVAQLCQGKPLFRLARSAIRTARSRSTSTSRRRSGSPSRSTPLAVSGTRLWRLDRVQAGNGASNQAVHLAHLSESSF
jgi:hypothetical protein